MIHKFTLKTNLLIENVLLLPGILSLVTIYSLLPAYWYHWIDLGHDYVNVYFLTALISNFVLVFMIIDLVRSRLLLHLVAENPGLSVSEVHQK